MDLTLDPAEFDFGRISTVRDRTFLNHVKKMTEVFPIVDLHREALRLLGSEIVYVRELSGSERGCWLALVRFGRVVEGSLALTREVMTFYSPHYDLQLRTYARLPEVRASLPRKPTEDLYLISSPDPTAARKLDDWTVREAFGAVSMPGSGHSAEEAAQLIISSLTHRLASRNLYEETLPVTGRDFFGRHDLLLNLTEQLRQGKVCGIFGLRKTGKTSLVKELGRRFVTVDPQRRIFVLRDLEDLPSDYGEQKTSLLIDLTASILPQLRNLGLRTHELVQLKDDATFGDFKRALQATLGDNKSKDVQIVVALDEVESLIGVNQADGVDRPYVPEFLGLLRALVQENPNFNVLISGLTSSVLESGLMYGRENPLFAWAKPHYVPPLEVDDANDLVNQVGRRMALRWTQEALVEAYSLTEGHVFLHRSLCALVAGELPRDMSNRVVTADMITSVKRRWIRGVSEQVSQMMRSFDRFYPDDAAVLGLLINEDITQEELDGSYSQEVDHLLKLGLVKEEGSSYVMTAFSRLAMRP